MLNKPESASECLVRVLFHNLRRALQSMQVLNNNRVDTSNNTEYNMTNKMSQLILTTMICVIQEEPLKVTLTVTKPQNADC